MDYPSRLAAALFMQASLSTPALELVTADDPPHNMQIQDGTIIGSVTETLEGVSKNLSF